MGRMSTHPAAHALIEARRTHRHAVAADSPIADASAAYAVQADVAQALGWFEGPAPGTWKSGGPSLAAGLTHARLPPAGVWASPAEAADWPFHIRGIEAEIALRLGRDVDAALAAGLDAEAAARLVESMCVSIEVVDTRWVEGLGAPAYAKLADLQCHGALVLGDWVPYAARGWATQRCTVQIGAQPLVERVGTHSLGDPVRVLPLWLQHATRDGATVPAGSVVTTGTWVGVLHATRGEAVTARFEGVGSATLQL